MGRLPCRETADAWGSSTKPSSLGIHDAIDRRKSKEKSKPMSGPRLLLAFFPRPYFCELRLALPVFSPWPARQCIRVDSVEVGAGEGMHLPAWMLAIDYWILALFCSMLFQVLSRDKIAHAPFRCTSCQAA